MKPITTHQKKWESQEAEMQDTSAVIQAWVVNSLFFFQPTGYAFESLFLDTLHLLDPGVPQIYTNKSLFFSIYTYVLIS